MRLSVPSGVLRSFRGAWRPADALRLGGLRDGPAVNLDPRHQQPPIKHVETGRTVGSLARSSLDMVLKPFYFLGGHVADGHDVLIVPEP